MKVKFVCATHDLQSKEEEIMEVPDDLTEEELTQLAEDYFWETKEPCWYYEIQK